MRVTRIVLPYGVSVDLIAVRTPRKSAHALLQQATYVVPFFGHLCHSHSLHITPLLPKTGPPSGCAPSFQSTMTSPCAPSTARAYPTTTPADGPPPFNQPLWTFDEHNNFLDGLKEFGRSWESISLHLVPTRTTEQVKNYAALYFYNEGKKATSAAAKPAPARKAPPAESQKKDNGHWTDEEHEFFLECWAKYGKSWKKISEVMKTRTNEQVRTHAQKYFAKLNQLRACGYEGGYAMDGTRHLTKAFLKKAEEKGISPGNLKTSFKMSSSRGVVKRRANRQGKAVARLRGGSSAPRRGKPQGGKGVGKKEAKEEEEEGKEEEGAGKKEKGEVEEGAESLLQLAVTGYTTRGARVVTSAQPVEQAQTQAQAATAMEVDEGEGGAAHEEQDDRKQEAAPTVAMTAATATAAAAVVMTINTGAGQEGEGEEGLNDFYHDQGHADDQHDAKQEEHGQVERAGMEIDATAELVAVAPTVPTPRTAGDILISLTMDPNGVLLWGQADRGSGAGAAAAAAATVPEGWVVLPEVSGGRNNTRSLSIATTTTHVSAEVASSISSGASTASTSEGATQRDSMLLMMSSADGSLLWESDGFNAEEEDDNSLTRPPTSPAAAADSAHWAADEEGLWAGEEGGKGEGEATAKKEGAAVFEI